MQAGPLSRETDRLSLRMSEVRVFHCRMSFHTSFCSGDRWFPCIDRPVATQDIRMQHPPDTPRPICSSRSISLAFIHWKAKGFMAAVR